jgi:hypothetical protein
MLAYAKYKRYWAVYESEELLCVTVYKKGARAVIDRIRDATPGKEKAQGSPARPAPRGAPTAT